jgi:hypothetical protein
MRLLRLLERSQCLFSLECLTALPTSHITVRKESGQHRHDLLGSGLHHPWSFEVAKYQSGHLFIFLKERAMSL